LFLGNNRRSFTPASPPDRLGRFAAPSTSPPTARGRIAAPRAGDLSATPLVPAFIMAADVFSQTWGRTITTTTPPVAGTVVWKIP
jgi:hypothetical protein